MIKVANMYSIFSPTLYAIAWLVGIIITMELGRRIGLQQLKQRQGKEMAGLDMMGGVVFTLCGLLIAFTLTGGASRYDSRRMLIAQEANDIGTAYLRVDLLSPADQPAVRKLFKEYVDSRIAAYRKVPDLTAASAELRRSAQIQEQIWRQSILATRNPGAHVDAAKLLLPALNNMIDITTTRLMAARIHPPNIIYIFLFILGLGCSLVAGIRLANTLSRRWLHIVIFAIVMSLSAYVILALEYPRFSFINLSQYDQLLIDLGESMK
jgi:hypothetical protein